MKDAALGVVLLNMGGPDALEDVPPYLRNIFRDPHILDMPLGFLIRPWLASVIVKKRAAASADRYRQIGGRSPLNDITRKQARVLQDILARRGVNAAVIVAMRYWHPLAAEAATRLVERQVRRVVALSMYPAYSYATTGSSIKDLRRALKLSMPEAPVACVDRWQDLDAYVSFLARRAVAALESFGTAHFSRSAVLFTAHSLPIKLIEQGDPYKDHIEQTYRLVRAKLPPTVGSALGWQSAVGPAKWLRPDTKSVAADLRHAGADRLVVAPLGFAAENIETLWDIDIDLKAFALEQGYEKFKRIECPNENADVLSGLADLVMIAAEGMRNGD